MKICTKQKKPSKISGLRVLYQGFKSLLLRQGKKPGNISVSGLFLCFQGFSGFSAAEISVYKTIFQQKKLVYTERNLYENLYGFYIERICRSVAVFSTYSAWHFSHASCIETGG